MCRPFRSLAATSTNWEDFRGVAFGEQSTVFLSGAFYETLTIAGCTPRASAGDADALLLKRKP